VGGLGWLGGVCVPALVAPGVVRWVGPPRRTSHPGAGRSLRSLVARWRSLGAGGPDPSTVRRGGPTHRPTRITLAPSSPVGWGVCARQRCALTRSTPLTTVVEEVAQQPSRNLATRCWDGPSTRFRGFEARPWTASHLSHRGDWPGRFQQRVAGFRDGCCATSSTTDGGRREGRVSRAAAHEPPPHTGEDGARVVRRGPVGGAAPAGRGWDWPPGSPASAASSRAGVDGPRGRPHPPDHAPGPRAQGRKPQPPTQPEAGTVPAPAHQVSRRLLRNLLNHRRLAPAPPRAQRAPVPGWMARGGGPTHRTTPQGHEPRDANPNPRRNPVLGPSQPRLTRSRDGCCATSSTTVGPPRPGNSRLHLGVP